MSCIIVADGGSSKIDWGLAPGRGRTYRYMSSRGLNVLMAGPEEIEAVFNSVFNEFESELRRAREESEEIHFFYYGAGCATDEACEKIRSVGRKFLPSGARISVGSDLTGAAVALFNDQPGIACILGTGSNSGYYDGNTVVSNIPPLGYILGDEGSGASIGKRFVNRCFKSVLPVEIKEEFISSTGLGLPEILERVYRQPEANKFLASIVPFIAERLERSEIRRIVEEEFEAFLTLNVDRYKFDTSVQLGFIGSIALIFHRILEDTVSKRGLTIHKIIKSPIEPMLAHYALKYS